MRKTTLRRLLALAATTGLATALAACGPDDAQQSHAAAPLLAQAGPQPGWSMTDLAGVDPAFLSAKAAPLPQAVPMRASYRGGYDDAPAFDYGSEPSYDDGYYADDVGADDYQWLALASALGGMLGDAPPDYGFGYDGVQPWAWETGDRYLRYAEPVYGGYRYYYYQPDSYAPFLVSDPYYSYGYRDDRLVAIYDRSGRVIDARRAERQRQAARDYYARARQMYLAAHREPRFGVAAPLWQRHRDEIVRQPQLWQQAKIKRAAWQQWDARNQPRLHRDWAGEALVRREAERSFSGWQKADFKTPAPRFYSPQQRKAQLQEVAEIRRDEQLAGQRRAAQRQAVAAGQRQQQLAAAERARQHVAQAQRQQAQAQHAALQRQQAQQRQAEAQNAQARQQQLRAQQQRAQQQRAQAERADAQRKVQAQKAQQQAQRQQAAREHQLQAQRKQQAHAAQQRKQAQQAHAAQEQKQAQQARAAERQQAQQARAAQQQKQAQQARRAQQARAAQQQRQAQQQQARAAQQQQRQAQQARAAQQQQQARAAQHQQQQAARAAAAKQRSGGKGQGAQGGGGGHGRGHGHG